MSSVRATTAQHDQENDRTNDGNEEGPQAAEPAGEKGKHLVFIVSGEETGLVNRSGEPIKTN
jgi:hypothetical protein